MGSGRKHHQQGHAAAASPRPPKRLKVAALQPGDGELAPLACYFPAGHPPPVGAAYTVFETATVRAKHYTLVGQADTVEYVGGSRGEEYAPGPPACSYVVGVLDKERGSLELMPLAAPRVLRMEPRLPGLVYGAASVAGEEEEDQADETREQRIANNKRLVEAFGSTRRRRQLNAREEGTVRVEKLGDATGALQAMMGRVAADAEAQGITKEKMVHQVATARQLPPHNLEARTPWEAFPYDTLVPGGAAGSLRCGRLLKAAEDSAVEQDVREKRQVDPYVLSRLTSLRGVDSHTAKQRALLLTFLSALLSLKGYRGSIQIDHVGGGLGKKASELRMTPELLEALLAEFYHCSHEDGRARYNQDKEQQSRLVAYICVTALLAEPGACLPPASCSALAATLKLPLPDLVTRFREVGATCVASTFKTEDAAQGEATSVRSYTVTLLPDPSKTLAASLPAIKLGRPKQR